MEPAHETPAHAGRTAQLVTANAGEMQFPGTTAIQKTEAAFRREMVKLIEAKTNGLVADASTR
jgi:hypothetical protein